MQRRAATPPPPLSTAVDNADDTLAKSLASQPRPAATEIISPATTTTTITNSDNNNSNSSSNTADMDLSIFAKLAPLPSTSKSSTTAPALLVPNSDPSVFTETRGNPMLLPSSSSSPPPPPPPQAPTARSDLDEWADWEHIPSPASNKNSPLPQLGESAAVQEKATSTRPTPHSHSQSVALKYQDLLTELTNPVPDLSFMLATTLMIPASLRKAGKKGSSNAKK